MTSEELQALKVGDEVGVAPYAGMIGGMAYVGRISKVTKLTFTIGPQKFNRYTGSCLERFSGCHIVPVAEARAYNARVEAEHMCFKALDSLSKCRKSIHSLTDEELHTLTVDLHSVMERYSLTYA